MCIRDRNKTDADLLVQQADSSDHARKIWALWTLGLMGNRGVETERVVHVLAVHLKDSDEDSRRWAVEGLGLVGTKMCIRDRHLSRATQANPSPACHRSSKPRAFR